MALIMVVEDNVENMTLARDLLEFHGYEVFSCTNGEEALKGLSKIRPDLILMDIQLPQTDGFQLTKKIRKLPGMDDVPVLAFTALVMPEDREKADEVGMVGYVSKPIDTRKFPHIIESHIDKSSS